MKIAVISAQVFSCPPNGYAGLEMITWLQAKGLAEKGHQVTLIAPDGSSCPGCEIIQTGPPGRISEAQAYGGFPDIKEGDKIIRPAHPGYWSVLPQFDVIIDSSWNKWSYILKEEGRLHAPILGVLHAPVDTMYKVIPNVDKPCFVCISKDQAAHFQALFSKEARVAYNGADVQFYQPTGIPRSDRFLFLARFSEIKGADFAIEACKVAGVGLDLIGDTKLTGEPEYLKKIEGMCDGKQIRIVGPASRSECVHWFSQAFCMLHPVKRFREPFGLAPVESQLCGCPVIAWDNGAMRETIQHGETGWLVRSMDDMIKAIHNAKQHANKMRENCRQWARNFSVENMVYRYEELCHEALREGGW